MMRLFRWVGSRAGKLWPALVVARLFDVWHRPAAGAGAGPRRRARPESHRRHRSRRALLLRIANLPAGDTLYVYLDELSGNLDPIVGVLEGEVDFEVLDSSTGSALADAIASGMEPLEAVQRGPESLFPQLQR